MLNNAITIRNGVLADEANLTKLYRSVASIPGGLARTVDEVTDSFMHELITQAVHKGKIFVAEYNGVLVGMLVAYRVGPKSLAHVLKDVTVLVDPAFQGQGIGSALITALQDDIKVHHPEITRVELFTRETNPAIKLYKRLGFVQEGRFEERICNPDGELVADIAMAWRKPLSH